MQYPLTIEQFQYPEFEKGIGMEFIAAFINAINNVYERGREVKNSGFCFTADMPDALINKPANKKSIEN